MDRTMDSGSIDPSSTLGGGAFFMHKGRHGNATYNTDGGRILLAAIQFQSRQRPSFFGLPKDVGVSFKRRLKARDNILKWKKIKGKIGSSASIIGRYRGRRPVIAHMLWRFWLLRNRHFFRYRRMCF